jgi:hypothetical protein
MSEKKTPLAQLDPTVVSEVFTRQVAILAMGGKSSRKIAEELGQTPATIEAIQKRDDYKALLKGIGERDLNFEVMKMKMALSGMATKAVKVYEKVMDDYLAGKSGARDAVTVAQSVTRAMGADKDEGRQQDATITVVLPGGKDVVTFEAEK